ncbi:MAG TPA: ABC transporter substrate-binding protein [Kofleriaceae bacterium]|nr:ABC transporter substrate-binding protein [Kofleriaceae bacterium]
MKKLVAVALVLVSVGCFERGGKKRVGKDAAVAAADAADAAVPEDTSWLVREPDGVVDDSATITVALEAEPATLDVFSSADLASARVLGDVYEGLLCAAPGKPPEPCLAETVTPSTDELTWKMTLRSGVRFHDGSALSAADVIASYHAPGKGASATGPIAAVLDDLVAVTSPAPGEVELRFSSARATRARDLAMVPIAPARAIKARTLGATPVGTGPLKVVAWKRGQVIELQRFADYWGPAAKAERVHHRVVADRAEAVRLVSAGEIDVALQVPIPDAIAAAKGGVARFKYEQPAFLAAVYNARRKPLASPSVRRGLTALLDRPGIARTVLGGARVPSGPWAPGSREADPQVLPVPFDRALAEQMLGTSRPEVELLVPQGSTSSARIADIWASDARGLATIHVVSLPFADLLGRLAAGEFDVAITSMSGGPDVDLWSRMASTAPPTEAWCGLDDASLDALLDIHRGQVDPEMRAESARAVHRRIDELQPMAFIAVDTRAGLARAGIGGVVGGQVPRMRDLSKHAP